MSQIGIAILEGTVALLFSGAGLLTEPIGVYPEVGRNGGGISGQYTFEGNLLSKETTKLLIESALSQAITEVDEIPLLWSSYD